MDNERLTFMRRYRVPCHVWSSSFFEFIFALMGEYVCFDDNTIIQINMDVTRFMVRTKSSMVLNEAFNVHANDEVFMLKLVEDSHGPLRIRMNKDQNKKVDSDSSSDRSSGSQEEGVEKVLGSYSSVTGEECRGDYNGDNEEVAKVENVFVLFKDKKPSFDNEKDKVEAHVDLILDVCP